MRSESPKWPPRHRLIFSEDVKRLLKEPAGRLISGDPDQVIKEVKRLIEVDNPPLVIAVGDYTSAKLREYGARVNIYIIDGRVERRPCQIFNTSGLRVIECINEPGTICPEAALKLHELLAEPNIKDTVLLVRGEEDLLTLATIISAPEGSVIIYGQPRAGSVYVKVDKALKRRALEIVKLAESSTLHEK
jgi:uncharacterized protein (UPF0218 family)